MNLKATENHYWYHFNNFLWVTQNESNLILPELNACKFAETLMLKTKLHISFHLTITEIKIHKLITPGRGFHSG